jgi:polysaccharide biosynthesis transport protein
MGASLAVANSFTFGTDHPLPEPEELTPMGEIEPTDVNLRMCLQIIGRRFAWVVAVAVLAVAIAAAYVTLQKKQYSATVQLLVQPAGGTISASGVQQTVSQTDVLTELQLISDASVKGQVTRILGFTPKISAAEDGQTNVISLTAKARSPIQAAQVANTYARTFVANQRTSAVNALTAAEQQLERQISALDDQLKPLESESSPSAATTTAISSLTDQEAVLKEQLAQLQVAGSETPGGVEVVSLASPPTSPSSPRPLQDGVIALVIGLLLGVGAAFAAEYFDDKIYTKEEVKRLSGGVSMVAVIPRVKSWKKSKRPMLITEKDPFSPVTEAYRSLRTSLQFVGHDGNLKTILITSASGAEGKTSTVANLGLVFAKGGERVVVVGCDLRRPRLASFFGVLETPGLTSVLLGRAELNDVLMSVRSTPGLVLLGTGPTPPNPAELLGSDQAAAIFRKLAIDFDIVLIDSSPLLPVSDPLVLSGYADAVLLVVMAGQTTRTDVERASELLAQVDAKPTGIVLNRAIRRAGGGSEYGYGYKYRYSPDRKPEVIENNPRLPLEEPISLPKTSVP